VGVVGCGAAKQGRGRSKGFAVRGIEGVWCCEVLYPKLRRMRTEDNLGESEMLELNPMVERGATD
jgi:hypothetical protein